ncbi:LytTR family DNA-binding domain-containing protein [Aquimarina muelleri]|uniref:LytTR family DNA-binding domain-containing protein n=1 Tax=Aquimarina muelleri TaxID=279356 RepID=UPI0004001E1E|nr:LytTR family DNA-binding domain-containing protein [Aquimarina muelleri]MCX2764010.1 LytTR family transcriptional regulator [Aquimarina muelleri]
MIRLLSKPYPFLFSTKRNVVIAVLVGLLVAITSYLTSDEKIIQESLTVSKIALSLIFSLITFSSIILIFEILPKLIIPETVKETWTISKELGLISLLIFVIILFNFSFLILVSTDDSTILSVDLFFNLTIWAIIIGIIPSTVVVWINYIIILKENLKQVEQHNKKLQKILQLQKNDTTAISIPSDNKTEIIQFNVEHLLFIKSDGNYVEIYLEQNNQINKHIHRASLQAIGNELRNYPTIIRIHRSYIVNCRNIKSSKGTARNYQLFFSNIEQSIPVARNKFQVFNETIQNLKPIQNK